jgi:hypothetical protein
MPLVMIAVQLLKQTEHTNANDDVSASDAPTAASEQVPVILWHHR